MTFAGEGKTVVLVTATAAHQRRTPAPAARSGRRRRPRSDPVRKPDLLEDRIAQLDVAPRADVAWVRNVDLSDAADAAGARREDDDAVRELDRLVDVVRDEEDRLLL